MINVKLEEFKTKISDFAYVDEDLLIDEVGVQPLIVNGNIEGEDGAFFIELIEGVYYIPFFDDVDGEGNYRPSGDSEDIKEMNEESLAFLERYKSQKDSDVVFVKNMLMRQYEENATRYKKDSWNMSIDQLLDWKALLKTQLSNQRKDSPKQSFETILEQIDDILNEMK